MTIPRLALLLSFSVGLLSLSQEILWVRLVGFGQQGRPQAFAIVLTMFLVGIALGAAMGRQLCQRSPHLLRSAGIVLLQAATLDLASLYVVHRVLDDTADKFPALAGLILLGAALKGVLFPIVHQLGSDATREHRIGRSISRVYLGNVVGSSLGPVLTGFWLLDRVPVETAFALVGLLTALLGLLCLWHARPVPRLLLGAPLLLLGWGAIAAWQPPPVIVRTATEPGSTGEIRNVIQNKNGIIHVLAPQSGGGDITFGGNAYDGRISNDMRANSNRLDRAYVLAALHQAPKRVLVIGMSSGAWTRAVLGMPGVEHVDVIEINPGYIELIRRYPDFATMLDDPRLHVHIDDGRRWMRAHAANRYDLILQNTTHHWRAYTSMLLSAEHFRLVGSLLAEGGIFTANTTDSFDVYATALSVFPHVGRHYNFAYMSRRPLIKHAKAEAQLRRCTIAGRPAFDEDAFGPKGLATRLATEPLQSAQEHLSQSHKPYRPGVITDLNLLPEYRHGLTPLFGWIDAILPHDGDAEPPKPAQNR